MQCRLPAVPVTGVVCTWTPASHTASGLGTRSPSLVLCAEGWLCGRGTAPALSLSCSRESPGVLSGCAGTGQHLLYLGRDASQERGSCFPLTSLCPGPGTWVCRVPSPSRFLPSCQPTPPAGLSQATCGWLGLCPPWEIAPHTPPPCSAPVQVPALRPATTWPCLARLKTPWLRRGSPRPGFAEFWGTLFLCAHPFRLTLGSWVSWVMGPLCSQTWPGHMVVPVP